MSKKQTYKKPPGCMGALFERIGIFVTAFAIYVIILLLIYPSGGGNLPDWCLAIGVLIALIASAFDLFSKGIVSFANFIRICSRLVARFVVWGRTAIAFIRIRLKSNDDSKIETADNYRNNANGQATDAHEAYLPTNVLLGYEKILTRSGLNCCLEEIDAMDGHDFEDWCAEALRNSGFTNVSVTPGSGDQGVDVLAEKDGIKYAIQCKRYSSDLGNTPVQEVYLGKAFYKCHVGVVLTNQHFTAGAKEAASASGVLLWDREWIKSYLSKQENAEDDVHEVTYSGYKDELLPFAVDAVFETGIASVPVVQHKLNLGYARSARIIDEMEELGIIGAFRGSRPREILVTRDQWENMRK